MPLRLMPETHIVAASAVTNNNRAMPSMDGLSTWNWPHELHRYSERSRYSPGPMPEGAIGTRTLEEASSIRLPQAVHLNRASWIMHAPGSRNGVRLTYYGEN